MGDTSAEMFWAAHKVTIRGKLIQISSQIKRERLADIAKLERLTCLSRLGTRRIPQGSPHAN